MSSKGNYSSDVVAHSIPPILQIAFLLTALALLIITAVFWSYRITFPSLNEDAGCFLSNGRLLSLGFVPFRDLFIAYTPLTFYLFAFIEIVGSRPNILAYHLLLNFAVQLGGASLIYAILCAKQVSRSTSFYGAASYLFLTWSFDGGGIYLEQYVNFFILVAIFNLTKVAKDRSYLLAGVFLGLAFLCKQYGVMAVFAVCLSELATTGPRKRYFLKIGMIVAGAAVPVLLMLISLSLVGTSLSTVIRSLSGAGYASHSVEWSSILYMFLAYLPSVLLSPFLLRYESLERRSFVLLNILLLLFLSTPLLIRNYSHYYILVAPFASMLLALALDYVASRREMLKYFSIFLLLSSGRSVGDAVRSFNPAQIREEYLIQQDDIKTLSSNIPPYSQVLLLGDPVYMYLGEFLPPRAFGEGFGF